MFPVSLNPYFNPALSFAQSPFINPEWAMRAYAQHGWDPFQAQAYYRGSYPNAFQGIGDPSSFNLGTNPQINNPVQTQAHVPFGTQSQVPFGFGSPVTSQGQFPIGFIPPTASQSASSAGRSFCVTYTPSR